MKVPLAAATYLLLAGAATAAGNGAGARGAGHQRAINSGLPPGDAGPPGAPNNPRRPSGPEKAGAHGARTGTGADGR